MGFVQNFFQTFIDDIIPILSKLFHNIESDGILPNSFFEATITLVPKAHKDRKEKRTTDQSHL